MGNGGGGGDGGERAGDLLALAPAAALLLLSVAFGTFPGTVRLFGVELPGGASAVGAGALHVLLLVAALFAAPAWRQPLALGRRGRFLLLSSWVVVVASAAASPVARAGRVATVLLPAWLLVPAAVARCWPDRRRRRWGLVAVATVVGVVALVALADRFVSGAPRAAMPLGHHNLLAVWLLALLPCTALPLRERGAGRWLAAAALVAGAGALVASGSLAGMLGASAACAASALGWATRRRGAVSGRHRALAAVGLLACLAALAVAAPRLASVFAGEDPSLAVRGTYYRAGWAAFLARPLLGWGPGSTPWTIGDWIVPVPGLNPPHEVIGDLHSLPLQILAELGLTGFVFAVALTLLFPWRRLVALPVAADRGAVLAGLCGLLAAGVALLSAAPLAVPAVPAALCVAAGAALAGEGGERRQRSRGDLPLAVYAVIAALLLSPGDRAHWAADRSLAAAGPEAERQALAEAVRLDPAFPLYRARLALLAPVAGNGSPAAARALEAAEAAGGVGSLWLAAGEIALAAGEPWAPIALERACRLDPLGAEAPYLLAIDAPAAPAAPLRAARAIAAEPRLAAALAWRRHPRLRRAAVAELESWQGIDHEWRLALAASAAATADELATGGPDDGAVRLALVVDRTAAGSLSLHAFRRRPRPIEVVSVPLDRRAVRHFDLAPATMLATTSPAAFAGRGCRGDEPVDER